MAGRPSKKTDQVVKKLEEAAALDCTIEEMCFYAGISKPTYYQYLSDDPALLDRLEALRNEPVLAARTTIVEAVKKNPQTAAWYLERKRKKEFAERRELTGEDGKPLFDDQTKDKARQAVGAILDQGDAGEGN
jgi:hypothetical protein